MLLGSLLISVALLWLYLVNHYIPDVPSEGEPGPRALPFLLGVLLAILGVALAVQSYAGRVPPSRIASDARADPPSSAIAFTTFALLIAYAFLLERAGFLAATVVLMVAAMVGILRLRRWVFVAVLAVGVAGGTWLVFNGFLGIPLPRGTWFAAME